GVGMKLSLIPAGRFLMGSPDDESGREKNEGPWHPVTITRPFYLGAHEVTVGQFREFVRATKHVTEGVKQGTQSWRSPGFEQTDAHPVVFVSWDDATAFCEWLSKKEKKTYRLPTEAEW